MCQDNYPTLWRHQMETFSALLALCEGNHRSPVNSPHKDQWRGALMFSLICAWTNSWANNGDADDLRLHRAHYDVTVMNDCFDDCFGFAQNNFHSNCVQTRNTILERFCSWVSILSTETVIFTMTASNGHMFRVTGPLCGEFTGNRWIPFIKASDSELWCFLWSAPE